MASAADYTSLVQELYVAYFGRPADPVGLAFYSNALLNAGAPTTDVALGAAYSTNAAVAAIINGFGNSPESAKLYAGTDADFVTAIFENVLGRPPLIAGLLSFVAAIENGTLTRAEAALNIISDAANNVAGNTQGALDALTVANKLGVAANFTTGLDTATLVTSYEGTAAASDARQMITSVTSTGTPTSYAAAVTNTTALISGIITGATVALTAGADTLSAQIFDGVLSATAANNTLNSFDHLTGSAPTNNILNLNSDGTGIPTGVTVSNIQTVNIHSTGDQSANIATWAGVTALNVTDVGVVPATILAATAAIVASGTTAVTVTGDVLNAAGLGAGSLTVTGGSAVTLTASAVSATSDQTMGNVVVTGATGAVVVNTTETEGLSGSTFGNVTVSGGTTVTINSNETAGYGTSTGEAAAITVSGATGAVVVNSNTVVADPLGHVINSTAVNVTGGTTVTVNDVITASVAADASASATGVDGAVTVLDGGTATSVTINETVESHLAPVTAVTAGAISGGVTAAPGITGVAGSPSPAARAAVPGAIVIGAGEVTIDGASVGTGLANASSTITSVTLDNYGGSSSINSAVLNTLTLSGTGGGLTVYNVGTTPITTLALNLNGLTDATGITETGITTLNVVTGTANSTLGAFADASLATLNVSGSEVLQLPVINTTNSSLTKIAVTGAAGFSDGASSHLAGFASLGAATFTTTSSGAISIAVNDTTQTFTGSTGKDTILISDLAPATKAITAGTAAGNELILEGGAYALTSATAALVTGFQTLGVEANVTGTIDMSQLDATASALDIIGNSTIAFTKVAANASVLLDANSTAVVVGYADGTGATDTVSVMLGAAGNAAPIDAFALTLQDANLVGIGTINLATTGAANIISTLTDNGLAHLNVSGTGSVTISILDEATTQATSFTLNNTSTGGATITTFTDISLGGLTFTGATASTVTSLVDSASLLQITAATGASAAIVTLTDNLLTSLTLSGNVSLGQEATADSTKGLQDSSTAGVTVNGSADNAHITLNLTGGAAVGNTDTISVGNGNDYILDASTAGVVKVAVGSGSNLIDLHTGSASTYLATVTLGSHTAASGADDILVGTVAAGATAPNVVIHGAVAGDDIIFTDVVSSAVALTTLQQTTVTGEANLAAAVLYVDGLVSTIAHSTTAFEYGGNAYLIESAAAGNGTLTANDGFVELAGLASTTGIVDSGAVALNLTLTTAVTTYNGGAANDTFTGVYSDAGGGGDTFLSSDTINGHGGTNTLTINPFAINTATTLVDANFGNGTISNIQDLVFSSTGTGNFGLTTGNHFNADFSTLNLTSTTTTGTLGLTMDSYVTAATLSTTSTTGNQLISIGTNSGTAADSVTAHSTTGSIGITVGNGADTILTGSTTGAVGITAGDGNDTITSTSTTGPLTISAGNGTDTITATATTVGGVIGVSTGTGIDSVTATSADAVTIISGSTTGDTLLSGTSTGSAALTINASGAATTGTYNITANDAGGAITIHAQGGTGAETYNITLGSHSGVATIYTSEIGSVTGAVNTIITGVQANDVIQIADTTATTFSSLGGEADVPTGVNAAHTSFPGPGNVQLFTYGGNTYLVEDVASNTPLATSTVIELVGSHTIHSVSSGAVTLQT